LRPIATRLERRTLEFRRPVHTARGDFRVRETVLVELCDADGVRGLGEASHWPGFGWDDLAATESALRAALTRLETMDTSADPATLLAAVAALLNDRPVAHAAIEGAICDLAARRADQSLAAWLARRIASSAPPIERVASSALLIGRTPDAVREEAMQVRTDGYAAAKLKLGGVPLDEDIARVRAARAGLGNDVRLRGDANGAWGRAEAAVALDALAAFDLEYVEQPVASEDLAGLAALRGRTPVRVAADEAVASEGGLRALIDARAADLVVLKPALLGGPRRTLALATQARAAGLDVVFTHALDSAVGAWHAVHCAAAWGDATAVHGLHTAGLFAADAGPAVAATAGFVALPAGAGLGFESWA
jgi:o-succinylbenzoate synthase